MEYISLSHVQYNVTRQYGKQKHLKIKINNYFNSFVDQHHHIHYAWIDNKVYVQDSFSFQLKKEIEKMLNKQIRPITSKHFSKDSIILRDFLFIKERIDRKNRIKKEQLELRKNGIQTEFFSTVDNIKSNQKGFRFIGAFDLEFWEQNMDYLLEFGWSIIDYKGRTTTTHLIVQENLKYENGIFSKNNRYARKDSQTLPLKLALKKFKTEFIDKVDVLIGHGLDNDFKVLEKNGLKLDLDYLDTADIGSTFMGEDEKVSLERLLTHLDIKFENLHNAANDVEYVLKAFCEMGDL